jgi:hypothetical protein
VRVAPVGSIDADKLAGGAMAAPHRRRLSTRYRAWISMVLLPTGVRKAANSSRQLLVGGRYQSKVCDSEVDSLSFDVDDRGLRRSADDVKWMGSFPRAFSSSSGDPCGLDGGAIA